MEESVNEELKRVRWISGRHGGDVCMEKMEGVASEAQHKEKLGFERERKEHSCEGTEPSPLHSKRGRRNSYFILDNPTPHKGKNVKNVSNSKALPPHTHSHTITLTHRLSDSRF